jgi:two-component system, NarL family, sensor kinase
VVGSLGSMASTLPAEAPRIDPPSRRTARPQVISVRRMVLRFALAGLPALAAAIVITAVASVRIGTKLGIDDAVRITSVSAQIVEDLALTDDLVGNDKAAAQDARLKIDKVVRQYIVRGALVRVKIWDAKGVILYANEPRLVGKQYPLEEDAMAVLHGRADAKAEVSDLRKPENEFETEKRLLEVYEGAETPGNHTPLLFETYFRYDAVKSTGASLWRQFGPIAVGALLLLELVQIPFAWSMARRLRTGQRQRERLLQHAIDSSDAERRRIASDLHDGAVQDLTGVSMSLAAAARSTDANGSRETMTDAGSKIRETVKSLRSMLVDIYPPNLHEEGIESALADLVAGLHNRGIATELHVDLGSAELSRESVSLLYRSAQEAVRNVAAHSNASEVVVRVRSRGSNDIVLSVEDDGDGFDGAIMTNRVQRGHVGLRSLAGLLQDAGGGIEIRSQPGQGTFVQVTVPR